MKRADFSLTLVGGEGKASALGGHKGWGTRNAEKGVQKPRKGYNGLGIGMGGKGKGKSPLLKQESNMPKMNRRVGLTRKESWGKRKWGGVVRPNG